MFTSVTPHPVTPIDGVERGLARLWYQLGPGSGERQARPASRRGGWPRSGASGSRPASTSGSD